MEPIWGAAARHIEARHARRMKVYFKKRQLMIGHLLAPAATRRPVGRCPSPRRSIIRKKHRLRIWRRVRLSTDISCGGSLNGPYSSLCAQAGRSHACGHTCTLHTQTHTHPHTIKSKNKAAGT